MRKKVNNLKLNSFPFSYLISCLFLKLELLQHQKDEYETETQNAMGYFKNLKLIYTFKPYLILSLVSVTLVTTSVSIRYRLKFD